MSGKVQVNPAELNEESGQVEGQTPTRRVRKNTLVLFSKVPEAGKVKTRLTRIKDGTLPPQTAASLYHCMLFDVTEVCCVALSQLEAESAKRCEMDVNAVQDTYELVISTTPVENIEVMRKLYEDSGVWPRPITFAADTGKSFDEHYNDAFQQAWDAGADIVLSFGADMPALTVMDVKYAFTTLHELDETPEGGIVLAPDQAMGVSIVGWQKRLEFDHTGVYYNQDGYTVLPAYIAKVRERGIAARMLPAVPDVDTMGDLMHNITLVEALNYTAPYDNSVGPWRTAQALETIGLSEVRVPPNDLIDPREDIDK